MLLLEMARPTLDPSRARRFRQAVAGVDWRHLIDRARLHGVMALLYHHLARHASDAAPSHILRVMHREATAVQMRNLLMMQELVRLVHRCSESGIPILPFKGPVLARRYYGELSLRQFQDVDVLVRRENLEDVWDLLHANGYQCRQRLTEAEARVAARDNLGREFVHPERGVSIEIHSELLNRELTFRLSGDAVWDRAVPSSCGRAGMYELSPEDLLLYLCAHGAKHHWSRLLWVCDVAQVLHHHPDLDGQSLRERAREIGSLRTLHLGLALARRWLDAPLPTDSGKHMDGDPMVDRLVREIEDRWFGTELGLKRPAGWQTFWFTLRTRQRLRDNWAMILRYGYLAVTPTDNDRAFAGASTPAPFLYLARPFRLLAERLGLRSGSEQEYPSQTASP